MFTRPLLFLTLMGLGLALAAETEMEKASHLMKFRRPTEAQALLERIVQADSRNVEAMVMLGEVHLRYQNPDKAREYANKAIQINPGRASAHLLLADALAMQTKKANMLRKITMIGDVRTEYEKAVQLDPRNRNVRQGLFQFYLQVPGIAGGGLDKAAAFGEQTQSLDPALGHSMKGIVHQLRNDPGAAQVEYRLAIAADPNYAPAYNQLGYLELGMKQLDIALNDFRKLVVLEPQNANSHDSLGDGLMAKGLLDEAINSYRRSTVLDPGFSTPFYHLGQALERKGQGAEAVAQYRRAASLQPEDRFVRLAKDRLAALGQK